MASNSFRSYYGQHSPPVFNDDRLNPVFNFSNNPNDVFYFGNNNDDSQPSEPPRYSPTRSMSDSDDGDAESKPKWHVTNVLTKIASFGKSLIGHHDHDREAEVAARLHNEFNPEEEDAAMASLTNDMTTLGFGTKPLAKMTIPELLAECRTHSLPTSYKRKADLVERLERHNISSRPGGSLIGDKPVVVNFNHVRGRPIRLFMVAEKPMMAREIAKVLNGGRRCLQENHPDLTVLKFPLRFYGYDAECTMTSTFGHIYSYDFDDVKVRDPTLAPAHRESFLARETRIAESLYRAEIKEVEADGAKNLPRAFARLASGYDGVVLWLDCDIEGEAICFEVIECIRKAIKPPPGGTVDDVVYRAKFSAAEEALEAVGRVVRPNYREYLAAKAKHHLDLRCGISISRYQTALLRAHFREHDVKHVSFGPCQTPTLAFCVEAWDRLQRYQETYRFSVGLILDLPGFVAEIRSEPFDDEKQAEELSKKLKRGMRCIVTKIQRENRSRNPPVALNTTQLLKLASRHLGFGAEETMQIAERLYMNGLITYPRTETTRYPTSIRYGDRRRVVEDTLGRTAGGRGRSDVEPMDWTAASDDYAEDAYHRGENKGDHPPICPTHQNARVPLTPEQEAIYKLVCQHFVATFMPKQKYHVDTVTFEAAGVVFQRRMTVVDEAGFAKALPWEREGTRGGDGGINPANLQEGKKIAIRQVKIHRNKVPPPSLLTEAELIELMEKHSIGTDASIPSHIANILKRGYVVMDDKKSRIFKPTPLGISLVNTYRQCTPALVDTRLRADMEQQILLIARGAETYEAVMDKIADAFHKQFNELVSKMAACTGPFGRCFPSKDQVEFRRSSTTSGTTGRNNLKRHRSADDRGRSSYNKRPRE